jgi:Protein of unknown function (DUF4089)
MARLPGGAEPRVTPADVERLAALLGLPLEPDSVIVVAEYLAAYLAVAPLLAELPLADEVQPAPIFRP